MCNEHQNEERQMMTGKQTKHDGALQSELDNFTLTKENLLKPRGGKPVEEKEYMFQKNSQNSGSQLEQRSQEGEIIKKTNTLNEDGNSFIKSLDDIVLALNNIQIVENSFNAPISVYPQTETLVEGSNKNPAQTPQFSLDDEAEYDYEEFCKKLFNLFNDLRSNPEKHANLCGESLKPYVLKLVGNSVNALGWWAKLFDISFDYLKGQNKRVGNEAIADHLTVKVQEAYPLETHKFLVLSSYVKHNCSDMKVLYEVLSENIKITEDAFFKNFSMGIFCSYPVSEQEDRVILCLSKKSLPTRKSIQPLQ